MTADRYTRAVLFVDKVDPFPARSARPIRLPRRFLPSAVAIRAVQPSAGHNGGPKFVDERR